MTKMLEGQIDERVIVIYEADKQKRFDRTLEAIEVGVPIILTSRRSELESERVPDCCLGLFGEKEGSKIKQAFQESSGVKIFYNNHCDFRDPEGAGEFNIYVPSGEIQGASLKIIYQELIEGRDSKFERKYITPNNSINEQVLRDRKFELDGKVKTYEKWVERDRDSLKRFKRGEIVASAGFLGHVYTLKEVKKDLATYEKAYAEARGELDEVEPLLERVSADSNLFSYLSRDPTFERVRRVLEFDPLSILQNEASELVGQYHAVRKEKYLPDLGTLIASGKKLGEEARRLERFDPTQGSYIKQLLAKLS